ncbi:MAG: uracil-DNA glycosylase [Thermoplasmata archaeon]
MPVATALEGIAAEVRSCTLCRLHENRTEAVPGEGPAEAAIILIGEAPGRQEDEVGHPFVGMAGRVLDEALEEAGLTRSDVFITNVVKCRPPGNRNPKADEMEACRPYLLRQIEWVRPSVIVTLGIFGLRSLLGVTGKVARLRSEELKFEGTPVVATYHPAATRYSRVIKERLVQDLRRAVDIAGRD